jgi:hypothetical protein
LHPGCFADWFKTDLQAEFLSLQQKSVAARESEGHHHVYTSSFYHGKFKKYSAELAEERYLLKLRDLDGAPELPEVEYLCNQVAEILHIPVPPFYYIDFFNEKVFVTKVFIRKNGGIANLEHIYKFMPDHNYDCESLIDVIAKTTKRPHDVKIFLETLLFDALIGNHDRHGRNLGFVVTPSNICLAPIYDNVSYLSLVSGPMLGADFNPTGRVATKETIEPSMFHYVQELKRLGHQDLVRSFAKKIKLSTIELLIHQSFCSEPMKTALMGLIQKRFKELINELHA